MTSSFIRTSSAARIATRGSKAVSPPRLSMTRFRPSIQPCSRNQSREAAGEVSVRVLPARCLCAEWKTVEFSRRPAR